MEDRGITDSRIRIRKIRHVADIQAQKQESVTTWGRRLDDRQTGLILAIKRTCIIFAVEPQPSFLAVGEIMKSTISTAAACAALFAFASHGAQAASFDCDAKALQPDEKMICENRSLNDADVKMVTTFELLSGLLAMGARGTLQDEQTAWLKKRQACGADAACIGAAYQERLKQLDGTYRNINRPL